jgi:hypothetical protein
VDSARLHVLFEFAERPTQPGSYLHATHAHAYLVVLTVLPGLLVTVTATSSDCCSVAYDACHAAGSSQDSCGRCCAGSRKLNQQLQDHHSLELLVLLPLLLPPLPGPPAGCWRAATFDCVTCVTSNYRCY